VRTRFSPRFAAILVALLPHCVLAGLADCAHLPPDSRVACLDLALAERAPASADLRELDALVQADPAAGLAILESLESRLPADRALQAEWLDRMAEALRLLGRTERAADLALEALETDTGIETIEWRSAAGKLAWSAALEQGEQRVARAARALLAAGRGAEARDLISAALRLGSAGELRSLWESTGGGVVPGLDATPSAIRARPWFPRLPDARVPLVQGEPFEIHSARGRVLILSFWASWCEPCLQELPALGALYESEREHGLELLLINVGEAPDAAERFIRRLGLAMPVGIYDQALEDAFGASSLPTLIVADRQGRVRRRWDGYTVGAEREVALLARRLLRPEGSEPGPQIGEVLQGAELLEVGWSQLTSGSVDGLVVAGLDGDRATRNLVALAGLRVLRYDGQGRELGGVGRPRGAGSLRRADLDGDGVDELFAFRVGGRRVVRLDPRKGEHAGWESPAPLLDLALAAGSAETPGRLYLATTTGLVRAAENGEPTPLEAEQRPLGIAVVDGPAGRQLMTVGGEAGRCLIDLARPSEAQCVEGPDAWRLVVGPQAAGYAALPRGTAGVVGKFLDGAHEQVALVRLSGQLVILDVVTGRERYRARLDGLRALAAGDLDGDGADEIALGVGDRVVLLKRASRGE
jgi:thiol-disulfide isomerase/thioredoxin